MHGQTEAGLKEAAGSLELDKCTVKRLDGKLKDKSALVISSSVKGEYLLLHEAEAEIDSWVKLLIEKGSRLFLALSRSLLRCAAFASPLTRGVRCFTTTGGAKKYREAATGGGQTPGMCNYFGLSIQQLLAKEEGVATHGIPILVRKCAEHIRAHGTRRSTSVLQSFLAGCGSA
jgi:hypothetical protein